MMLTTVEYNSLFEIVAETATFHRQARKRNTTHWMVDETPNITPCNEPLYGGLISVAYYV